MVVPDSASDPRSPTETELKFTLDPTAASRLAGHPALKGLGPAIRLRSVYWDTPDRDLWRKGYVLRVREEQGGFEQALKTGAWGLVRAEWSAPASSRRPDPAAFPPEARTVLDAAAGLAPVFVTTVERRSGMVEMAGARIEASLDIGEVAAGGRTMPIHELELELKSGGPTALFALARDLMAATPLRLCLRSKAARGWRLADGEERSPTIASPSPVRATMTAVEAFIAIAQDCLIQVATNAELVQTDRGEEPVHQMRVGLRRLRAACTVFKPILEPGPLAMATAEADWLAKELDDARDLDVFLAGVVEPARIQAGRDAAFTALARTLGRARRVAHGRAAAAARSERFFRLMVELTAWLQALAESADSNDAGVLLAAEPVEDMARARLAHLFKQTLKRGRQWSDLDAPARHRVRIAAKKLRYASEFFAPLYSHKRRKRFSARLVELQDLLGAINDIAMARQIVTTRMNRTAAAALAAGRALGRREAEEPALLAKAGDRLAKLRKAEPFW